MTLTDVLLDMQASLPYLKWVNAVQCVIKGYKFTMVIDFKSNGDGRLIKPESFIVLDPDGDEVEVEPTPVVDWIYDNIISIV